MDKLIKKIAIAGPQALGQLAMLLLHESQKASLPIQIATISKEKPIWSDYHYTYQILALLLETQRDNLVDIDHITFESEALDETLLHLLNVIELSHPYTIEPSLSVIRTLQNRLREKKLLQETLKLPISPYLEISTNQLIQGNITEEITNFPMPAILKTCENGYDGIGQLRIEQVNNLLDSLHKLNLSQQYLLEKQIDLAFELSIILTRFRNGSKIVFPVTQNIHTNGILVKSIVREDLPIQILDQIFLIAYTIADHLDYIGTIAIEFFVDTNAQVFINEIAPRVHNSGHITQLCQYNINQFTLHLMAIANLDSIHNHKLLLPYQPSYQKPYNSMINILGLSFEQVISANLIPNTSNLENINHKLTIFKMPHWILYWYGKTPHKERIRKMGHILISANTKEEGEKLEKEINKRIFGVLK